jgi:hypothetical protein
MEVCPSCVKTGWQNLSERVNIDEMSLGLYRVLLGSWGDGYKGVWRKSSPASEFSPIMEIVLKEVFPADWISS